MMIKMIVVLTTVLASAHSLGETARAQPVLTNDLRDLVRMVSEWGGPKPSSWTNATPACQWAFVKCDPNGIVTELDWNNLGLTGIFNGTYLPGGLRYLYLNNNRFTGTPILSGPHSTLQYLSLHNNSFTGTPILSTLPFTMQYLDLSFNQFTGTPLLSGLPSTLQGLILFNNNFTGTPILFDLPSTLENLDLRLNPFCGSSVVVDIQCQYVYVDGTCKRQKGIAKGIVSFDRACTKVP